MKLHSRRYGKGEPLVILHGLFGSSDNWHSLARKWGESFNVYALDQRNHGSSFHEWTMNYTELVGDLHQFISQEKLNPVHLVGHSMGGKVALLFASTYPEMVRSLCVLDIGIQRVEGKHKELLQALSSTEPESFGSRDDIQRHLEKFLESQPLRQFLMKNILRRQDGSLSWKFNRDALLAQYAELAAGLDLKEAFIGPVLFLRAEKSDYLEAALSPEILQYFPLAQLHAIAGAGHWLHADKPRDVYQEVLDFLA